MAEANEWIGLMDQTREALAHLRPDELEALAARAQQALEATTAIPRGNDFRELAAQHRVLGDVLRATEQNIDVLRRLRGQEDLRGSGGSTRWVR